MQKEKYWKPTVGDDFILTTELWPTFQGTTLPSDQTWVIRFTGAQLHDFILRNKDGGSLA